MLSQVVLVIAFGLAFFLIYCGSVAWAVGDAQKRGQSGGLVVLLFCLTGPLSALLWLAGTRLTSLRDLEKIGRISPR